jgi:hypothetical protein
MQIDELQQRLAPLSPGQKLTLSPAEFERAFMAYRERDVRRVAAIELGRLYSCSVRFFSLERDEVVFTRQKAAGVLKPDQSK